jgi:hypothetical protein
MTEGRGVSTALSSSHVQDPCTPHLSHATLRTPPCMRDNAHRAHERWGAQGSCTRDDAGLCSHVMWEGLCFPSAPPCSHATLGFCTTLLHAMGAGQKGGGGHSCMDPFARTQKEGGVPAAPLPVCLLPSSGHLLLPPFMCLFWSMPEWGCHLSTPHLRRQGGGRRGGLGGYATCWRFHVPLRCRQGPVCA